MLFALCAIAYAYFFQGTGWNQNAQFDTIRALVEHRTFEITRFAQNTGDISRVGDRIYSNKPPGVALLGAPVYAVIYAVERAIGVDPDSPRIVIANMHLMTIALSAIPGALTIVATYLLFRRATVSRRHALPLSLALAFGSLIFPYSGAIVSQLPVAAALIWCWYFLFDRPLIAGVLVAIAATCDYFAAPLVGLFLICLIVRRGAAMRFCIGPLIAVIVVVVINFALFGGGTTYSHMDPYFKRDDLFLGQFHWPEWMRLYWITYHRMRGLFVCCPMFIVPIFSLVAFRQRPMKLERLLPILIVAHFVALILIFVGWTGGWGIGVRYLVPALPFLWLYARAGFERFPRISLALIALSILNMLAAVCVQVFYPANDSGPPTHWDPVSFVWLGFVRQQFAKSPDSYNLGMKLGLDGFASLLPLLVIVTIFGVLLWRYSRTDRAADSAASAQRLYIVPDGCNPSSATSDLNSRDNGVTST